MAKKEKAAPPAPADAVDIAACFNDSLAAEDALTAVELFLIPLGRPKNKFIRVHPTLTRYVNLYCYKPEGEFGEELYLIAKPMASYMADYARPSILVPYVDRDGNPGLWPLKRPKIDDGERPVPAWVSAIQAAKRCREVWGKVEWRNRAFEVKVAHEKYASDPDWSKLPDFDKMIAIAFGDARIIKDKQHRVYCDQIAGLPPTDDFDLSAGAGDEADNDAVE
jgi:hypothetical protein